MILGTYHFANPGLDAVKVTLRDTLGPTRQTEIADLTERLREFCPNKICVEVPTEMQSTLDEDFARFTSGEAELTSNEIQQIGFRLAADLRLGKLIAVDHRAPMDFDSLMQFAERNGKGDLVARITTRIAQLGTTMTRWDQEFTVSELLAIHNSERFINETQQFYTDLLAFDTRQAQPAAQMVAGWYARNLIIFENIRRQAMLGDRALVIYGSGHLYYLRQLIKDDSTLQLVDASKHLPDPPTWNL
jgi:Family of unknown function (DUF5694)